MKVSRRILAQAVATMLIAKPERRKHIMQATAAYLADNKMSNAAHIFINDLAQEIQRQSGHVSAEIFTAGQLSDKLAKQFEQYVKAATGSKSVDLHHSQNPDLLGGFVINTPDAALDKSVRRQLKQLHNVA